MDKKKLYVGGLSYDVRDEALAEAFAAAGTVVSAKVIMDKFSGRSKGFGFVEMSTEEEAQTAIEMFNDQEVLGRRISVDIARPMEERPPRRDFRGGGRRFSGGDNRDSYRNSQDF